MDAMAGRIARAIYDAMLKSDTEAHMSVYSDNKPVTINGRFNPSDIALSIIRELKYASELAPELEK